MFLGYLDQVSLVGKSLKNLIGWKIFQKIESMKNMSSSNHGK